MLKGTEKQKLCLKALTDNEHKTIMYGGAAGGGKSFIGCIWLLFIANSYPGTRWFIGREQLKRIRQSTLITWAKVCKAYGFTEFRINFQDNFIMLANGSQIDLLDLVYQPRDPMYERFGSIEYTGGWIEEGGEVNFGAFDTLKTRVGRHLNIEYDLKPKILVTCNPKKNWLYTDFYKPYRAGTLDPESVFIQAFVDDNKHLSVDYINNLKNTKDKAKKERLLYGNWEYDDDPSQLIDFDSAQDYFKNEYVLEYSQNEHIYITADIARKGRDTTIVRVWIGFACIDRYCMAVSKVTESADAIKIYANKYHVPMSRVVVDEDGVGGGVVDILNCEGFVNNSKPFNEENYRNLKAQCSFYMAEKIVLKECYEKQTDRTVVERTIEEMEQVKQADIDKEGKVGIIPKEKVKELIGRSPDEWDSIMMRAYFELKPQAGNIIW